MVVMMYMLVFKILLCYNRHMIQIYSYHATAAVYIDIFSSNYSFAKKQSHFIFIIYIFVESSGSGIIKLLSKAAWEITKKFLLSPSG